MNEEFIYCFEECLEEINQLQSILNVQQEILKECLKDELLKEFEKITECKRDYLKTIRNRMLEIMITEIGG